jgi:hypothetical protein
MSSSRITELIAHIPVHPTPLFCNDVDSTDSHDDDEVVIEETLARQDHTGLGEVDKLALSLGLLDLSLRVDMQEPWVEGPGQRAKR